MVGRYGCLKGLHFKVIWQIWENEIISTTFFFFHNLTLITSDFWVLTVWYSLVFNSKQRLFRYCLLLNWFLMRNFPLVPVFVQALLDCPFDMVSKKVQKKSSGIVFQMMHKWPHLRKSSAFQWRLTNNPKLEGVPPFPDLPIKIQQI